MTELSLRDTADGVTVSAGDLVLCQYVVEPNVPQDEAPRPYLHPVRTLAGDVVTIFRQHDHRHHHALSFALPDVQHGNFPDVQHENFWGHSTFVRDHGFQDLENHGTQRHDGFEECEVKDDAVRLAQRLTWITHAGETLLTELRKLGIRMVDDESWVLDFETALTNTCSETITFGSPTTAGRPNGGFGGLFWRGPRSFNHEGSVIQVPGGGGPDVMGESHDWLAYTGKHDSVDRASTLVFVDSKDNLRHPTPWFVRDQPRASVCAAPFFHEEHDVAAGDTLRLKYHIVIGSGAWDADRIASAVGRLRLA